jgi:hypothetical protein
MGGRVNWAMPSGEREMVVTGKREKWTVMAGVEGWELLGREEIREWVRGSRAVLEEGTRMPRRRGLGGILETERE